MSDDYLLLPAEDFQQLDDFQLQDVLQLLAGRMAIAQEQMRTHRAGHYSYLGAKEEFGYLKATASTIQTLLRSKV